jgi:hypothetical protein
MVQDKFLSQCAPEPNTGCWLWTGALDAYGYGRFFAARQTSKARRSYEFKAHRLSYELFRGPIPAIKNTGSHGACVLHTCDVRSCVNPDHLYVGTQADNLKDMDARGRRRVPPPGENHNVKLTPRDIPEIRRLHKNGHSFGSIGRRFGVDHGSIQHIIAGRSWRHVT